MSNTLGPAVIDHVMNGSSKMMVKYDNTGTLETDYSFNVTSLSDIGTGDCQVNINNDMSSAEYTTTASCNEPFGVTTIINPTVYAAGSFRCFTQKYDNTRNDVDHGSAAVTGDLA